MIIKLMSQSVQLDQREDTPYIIHDYIAQRLPQWGTCRYGRDGIFIVHPSFHNTSVLWHLGFINQTQPPTPLLESVHRDYRSFDPYERALGVEGGSHITKIQPQPEWDAGSSYDLHILVLSCAVSSSTLIMESRITMEKLHPLHVAQN